VRARNDRRRSALRKAYKTMLYYLSRGVRAGLCRG
jgi:hypothetical protein